MNSEETLSILEEAINVIDQDRNLVLSVFDDCIRKQAECMKRRVRTNTTDRVNDWFDHECRTTRANQGCIVDYTSLGKCKKTFKEISKNVFGNLSRDDRCSYWKLEESTRICYIETKKTTMMHC